MYDSQRALGMSRMYASAEGEMLVYLVDTLEGLLGIGRTLFGTAEWLTDVPVSPDPEVAPTAESEKPNKHYGVE
jgi:hypothetical protein